MSVRKVIAKIFFQSTIVSSLNGANRVAANAREIYEVTFQYCKIEMGKSFGKFPSFSITEFISAEQLSTQVFRQSFNTQITNFQHSIDITWLPARQPLLDKLSVLSYTRFVLQRLPFIPTPII